MSRLSRDAQLRIANAADAALASKTDEQLRAEEEEMNTKLYAKFANAEKYIPVANRVKEILQQAAKQKEGAEETARKKL